LHSNPPVRTGKSAQNNPLRKHGFFRLTWGLISGKVGLQQLIFPGFDRHHGPPLAGFAVSGGLSSPDGLKDGTANRRTDLQPCLKINPQSRV
jgi:hypothetical protein